jgi:hypothetical protein
MVRSEGRVTALIDPARIKANTIVCLIQFSAGLNLRDFLVLFLPAAIRFVLRLATDCGGCATLAEIPGIPGHFRGRSTSAFLSGTKRSCNLNVGKVSASLCSPSRVASSRPAGRALWEIKSNDRWVERAAWHVFRRLDFRDR